MGAARYGHRDEDYHCDESYTPDRLTGCTYSGHDAPWLTLEWTVHYDFSLNFTGYIVDTTQPVAISDDNPTGYEIVESISWLVACGPGTIPFPSSSSSSA
jgi:hypothetical protein